jgi:hypothetical protein
MAGNAEQQLGIRHTRWDGPPTSDHACQAADFYDSVTFMRWFPKPRNVVLWGARGDDLQAGSPEHLATIQPPPLRWVIDALSPIHQHYRSAT